MRVSKKETLEDVFSLLQDFVGILILVALAIGFLASMMIGVENEQTFIKYQQEIAKVQLIQKDNAFWQGWQGTKKPEGPNRPFSQSYQLGKQAKVLFSDKPLSQRVTAWEEVTSQNQIPDILGTAEFRQVVKGQVSTQTMIKPIKLPAKPVRSVHWPWWLGIPAIYLLYSVLVPLWLRCRVNRKEF